MLSVHERTFRCSGVGLVQLDESNRCLINFEVLVMDGKLLGFNLLLRFDAIKKLGGVCVTSDGTVSFSQLDRNLCTAITITEPFM